MGKWAQPNYGRTHIILPEPTVIIPLSMPGMNLITSTCYPRGRLTFGGSLIPTPQRASMAVGCNARYLPIYTFPNMHRAPVTSLAKKKNSKPEPVLNPSIVEEVYMDGDDDVSLGGFERGIFLFFHFYIGKFSFQFKFASIIQLICFLFWIGVGVEIEMLLRLK